MTDSPPEQHASWTDALRNRPFRLFWSGQAVSAVGNQMFPIALAVLAIQRGMGASGLGLVLAVQGIALAVGTLLGGSVGDRWRRTSVMIVSDIFRLAGAVVLAWEGRGMPVGALFAVVFVTGCGEGLFQPASNAVIPRLVPERLLLPANSLNGMSIQTAVLVGPAIAGVLAGATSPGVVLWADAATFAASFVTLVLIREPAMEIPEPGEVHAGPGHGAVRRAVADFAEGVRAVRQRSWIGTVILVTTIVMTLTTAPAYVLLPIESHLRLGGPAAYGAASAAVGLGSIVGALAAAKVRSGRPGLVALAGLFLLSTSWIALATLPLAGVIVFWAVGGMGVAVFNVLWMTALQRDVPGYLIGRVLSLDMLGSMALMPVGFALTGPLTTALGPRTLLIAAGVLVVAVVPLALLAPGAAEFATPARETVTAPVQDLPSR